MSFSSFSKSRSKGHYPYSHHGSQHYKKSHSSGILGKIAEAFLGSKRHSRSFSSGHHKSSAHHRRHKSSWS